jgi:hypothetical protein
MAFARRGRARIWRNAGAAGALFSRSRRAVWFGYRNPPEFLDIIRESHTRDSWTSAMSVTNCFAA